MSRIPRYVKSNKNCNISGDKESGVKKIPEPFFNTHNNGFGKCRASGANYGISQQPSAGVPRCLLPCVEPGAAALTVLLGGRCCVTHAAPTPQSTLLSPASAKPSCCPQSALSFAPPCWKCNARCRKERSGERCPLYSCEGFSLPSLACRTLPALFLGEVNNASESTL